MITYTFYFKTDNIDNLDDINNNYRHSNLKSDNNKDSI